MKIDLIDIQRRLKVRAPCHNDTVTNIATRGLEVISKWIHSHGKKAISNYQDQLGVVYSSFVSPEAKKCCPVARLRILISPSLHAVFSFTVIKYIYSNVLVSYTKRRNMSVANEKDLSTVIGQSTNSFMREQNDSYLYLDERWKTQHVVEKNRIHDIWPESCGYQTIIVTSNTIVNSTLHVTSVQRF